MKTTDVFRELYRHMRWADSLVWRAVFRTQAAEGDTSLRDRLMHLHVVQRAFLLVWKERPLDLPKGESFTSLAEVETWARPYYDEVEEFLASVDESALTRPRLMPWADRLVSVLGRKAEPTTMWETILQVPAHSTYHRGQINTRIRELGGEPPLVDFIAWVWLGRPWSSGL